MRGKKLLSALGLLLCAAVAAGSVLLRACAARPASPHGLFAWGGDVLAPERRAELLETLARLGAGTLYQELPEEPEPDAASFFRALDQAGVAVYALVGRAEWGLEADGASLCAAIRRLADQYGGRLAGVMADVEPYLTEAWDQDPEGVLEDYVDGMAAARACARAQGLPLLACVPYWYDDEHDGALERLVGEGCDGLAVMNYHRRNEAGHLRREVDLARAEGKPVVCIFEFQRPGSHELTEENTYYNAGLDAALESWQAVKAELNYDRLSFAYHYYEPVRELLDRED